MALRETLAQIRSGQASGGLGAVLVRVIQPLLTDLGWNFGDPFEVDLDHEGVDVVLSIPRGEHTSLADRRPGRPGVYVGFLPSEQQFSERAASLVSEAARDGADLCALTTGRIWHLYVAKPMQEPGECRYAQLDLQADPPERLAEDFDLYLSRAALIDQRAQRSAEHALTTRLNAERVAAAIPTVWRRLLAGPDSFLVEYVQEEVRKETGLHPSEEQVGDVIRASAAIDVDRSSDILRQANLSEPPSETPSRAEPPRRSATAPGHDASHQPGSIMIRGRLEKPRPRRATGTHGSIAGFQILDEEFNASRWQDVWIGVSEWLLERHPETFETVAFQYRGRSRQYISDSPDNHTTARRLGNSPYFAETNLSGAECESRPRDLLERFGYDRDALTIVRR